MGSSPEGQEVSLSGIFVKISPSGNLYVPPDSKEGKAFVTPELWGLVKAQHKKGMGGAALPVISV